MSTRRPAQRLPFGAVPELLIPFLQVPLISRVSGVQVQIHRRMSGAERLRLACEMSDAVRALALTRLRTAHPTWSERQLALELARAALAPRALPPSLR